MLALAEGKIDIASGPHVLPFLMGRAAGPYAKLGKEKGGTCCKYSTPLPIYF